MTGKIPGKIPGSVTRARIAALSRSRPPDDPELIDLRRRLEVERGRATRDQRAAYLADFVARYVAEGPLTDEQIARVDAILKAAPREQVAS